MISNNNASKMPSSGESMDFKKYQGVASVNVLSVNPSNAILRKYGWQISDDADEPKYTMTASDGSKMARVRFLVQIQDFNDKPVIPLDFWVRPEIRVNGDKTKCQIIDSYGRTAWATKAEVKAHAIPEYKSGPASISSDYKPCHPGEEDLVTLLMKYLNVTPLQTYDRKSGGWSMSKNPGRLTIDHWGALCDGNVKELAEYLALQPDNRVKVILGIRNTDDNKSYQTFISSTYIGNGAKPDFGTGEYTSAQKAIERFNEGRGDKASYYSFSAAPVKEWKEGATDVTDNSGKMFDDNGNFVADGNDVDDLPFG